MVGDGATIHASLFQPGQTLSSRIATDFQDIQSPLHRASLFYLAVILLAFAVATNLTAQGIANRFGAQGILTR